MSATAEPEVDNRPARRRVVVGIVQQLVLAGVLASKLAVCWRDDLDCAKAAHNAPPGIAVGVCQREYEKTSDPLTGVRLANAMRESANLDGAAAIANGLLATAARSDALYVLGKIAMARHQAREATTLLESARDLHRAESKPGDVARDDQALAGLSAEREQFAEALTLLDECIASSRAAHDGMLESYCHISAARVLSRVGYFEMAYQELDRGAALARSDRNRAWLELERGNLAQEVARAPGRTNHDHQAIVAFERVLDLAAIAHLPELSLTAELNLAHSLTEVGRPDDAERHLATARTLDWKHEREVPQIWLAARIAYRRGNLALAWSLNERAFDATTDHDDRLDIAVLQARIALARDDLAQAEIWAQRGVGEAEATRAAQSSLELRPWVLSTRREPYELLFATLARAGRDEDALLAFDRWQGRTLLDALARPSPQSSLDLRSVASRVANLGTWLPVSSQAPLVAGDRSGALAVLRGLDLVALAVAEGDLWSIAASHGRIKIRRIDSLANLDDRLARFRAAPTEAALASELGELLLGPEAFQATRVTLHVLLDGQLAALPVVALRDHGRPLIALRPVLRVPRLPDARCVPTARSGRATVLADASSDLPLARQEATEVAALLGVTGEVGPSATSRALFAANRDATLHVAVHGDLDSGGGTLKLSDLSVSALEISARKLGPSLVVLSACVTAASHDGELAGSLAVGFLAAGSAQVVATLRPVSDAGAHELSTRFYRAGGVADPVRVLAAVQSELAATPNTDWPNYSVFGHDACPPEP